ncbi:MAG: M23 family metallopeptidase [Prevotella sp.]|nr:M23 family metallopeptidase [Prevotella sp.]
MLNIRCWVLGIGYWLFANPLSASVQYHSPVDYKITLAGNFGEPRPNHFHGGLDIKTDNVEGKHIYAIGDGYVSRLTVGLYGFGNAVYVTHPEGYTSIYCHLRRFSPKLERMVKRTGRHDEQIDLHFTPLDFPVSQGQLIAISGNTGHSTGPHLHLEIHDTRTWDMMDPLDFIAPYVNDSVAPQAHSFMACPVRGKGVFNGGSGKQTFGFSSHRLDQEFTAWGKVGFALWADDYMQGVYNHYGIRETILLVDGQEVFRANVGRIPVYSNRQVNSWGDYDHWLHYKTWYMRSYIPKGVTLPILQADENDGYVVFNEERPYQIRYILRDYTGNESHYEFTVIGKEMPIPTVPPQRYNVCYDRLSLISLPGMQLTIPAGMVEEGTVVIPKVEEGSLSKRYTFAQQACPLFGWVELSIAIPHGVDTSRLYIDSGGHDMGGVCQDGWITTRIRELGASYELKLKQE